MGGDECMGVSRFRGPKVYAYGRSLLDRECVVRVFCSTISSGLNSLAAVFLQDLMRGLCCKDLSEAKATLASKIIC